ncbi:PAS domain-containing protein [Comamonas thiooxydans]|uniref:PAS domain-containing protein n=1 Tax=Comamonas thiooxydans TaxID=363952 RepID=UPI001ED8E4A3|nr:PAS domain-containing protein [Comamonas thiooxydans]
MSTTDTESYIKYANQAFMEVSGFEPQEILGQTHNLVRHPDMPPAAFADHVGHPQKRRALERTGQETGARTGTTTGFGPMPFPSSAMTRPRAICRCAPSPSAKRSRRRKSCMSPCTTRAVPRLSCTKA